MPVLAAFLGTVFTALGAFLAKLFLAKLAIRIAGVAGITAAGTALITVFNNHLAPLVAQLFSTQYGQLLGLAFPPIAGTVIASIVGIWAACATYSLQVRAIKLTSNM